MHMFFACEAISTVWDSIHSWLGVSLVSHHDPTSHFFATLRPPRSRRLLKIGDYLLDWNDMENLDNQKRVGVF
ncbi:hypothetical protein ACS0TY_035964 [Phlomoides rotata]